MHLTSIEKEEIVDYKQYLNSKINLCKHILGKENFKNKQINYSHHYEQQHLQPSSKTLLHTHIVLHFQER